MKKTLNILALIFVVFFVAACGTTSSIYSSVNTNSAEGSQAVKGRPDLSKYDKILVRGFGDKITEDEDDSLVLDIGSKFADFISFEIKKTRSFSKVIKEADSEVEESGVLLITGDVTKYKEGNQVLRGLVGMGAGSSGFDANVYFIDNKTGNQIGEIEVDKNSWLLGGMIAANQTVDVLMQSAAKKIASEVSKAKLAYLNDK